MDFFYFGKDVLLKEDINEFSSLCDFMLYSFMERIELNFFFISEEGVSLGGNLNVLWF